jgi:cell division protein FtsW (lipid II flippase)
MTSEHDSRNDQRWRRTANWVLVGFVLIAAYFLIAEHRAHVTGWLASYWIWLLLLACPLMHLFMHRGHGHGGHGDHQRREPGDKSE